MKQVKIKSENGVTLRVRKYVDGMIGLQRTYRNKKAFTDIIFIQADQVEPLMDFLNDNLCVKEEKSE